MGQFFFECLIIVTKQKTQRHISLKHYHEKIHIFSLNGFLVNCL